MKNHKKSAISILIFVAILCSNCRDENHVDRYHVNIDSLKSLPDNFYAYRGGRIFIDTDKYVIWFNLDCFGNVESVYKIDDVINHEKNQNIVIYKYSIDTVKSKIIAQKFKGLSLKYRFGHINIQKKNKIAFSYKNGLPEQYVITFNDSLRNIYIKNEEFRLLKNGWFENIGK